MTTTPQGPRPAAAGLLFGTTSSASGSHAATRGAAPATGRTAAPATGRTAAPATGRSAAGAPTRAASPTGSHRSGQGTAREAREGRDERPDRSGRARNSRRRRSPDGERAATRSPSSIDLPARRDTPAPTPATPPVAVPTRAGAPRSGATPDTSVERAPSDATFASLGVADPLVRVLAEDGKRTAFPIQAATLPDTLAGRDVLGRGRTGSGKTLAFALPLVQSLAADGARANVPHRPRALVLAPTRELASQIAGVIDPLAAAYGLRVTTVFGGVKQVHQERELARGAAVVVACPGRLEDLMGQRLISLGDIRVTVIDEADLMADMGFLPSVTRILRATPAVGQRMLFSATLDNGVDRLVREFLHSPLTHSVDPAESPVERMTHHVFEVADEDAKKDLVRALASGRGRRILFFRTKHRAKRTARQLTAAGIPTVDLQGNLSQNARDRNLAAFEDGSVRVLAATDVAARGVDVTGVELVVHADPPREQKEYLHRSGRTARAGEAGDVVTICLPQERRDLAQVLRSAKIHVSPERVDARSPEVTELVGEPAARVAPSPAAADPSPQGRGSSAGSSRGGSGAQGSRRSGRQGSGRSGAGADRAGSSRTRAEAQGRVGGGAAAFSSSRSNRTGRSRRGR